MEAVKSAFNILTAKPTGKRYLRRLSPRCGRTNIGMDLKEIGLNTSN